MTNKEIQRVIDGRVGKSHRKMWTFILEEIKEDLEKGELCFSVEDYKRDYFFKNINLKRQDNDCYYCTDAKKRMKKKAPYSTYTCDYCALSKMMGECSLGSHVYQNINNLSISIHHLYEYPEDKKEELIENLEKMIRLEG